MPTYNVTISRELTDVLTAQIRVPADNEDAPRAAAKKLWEIGDIELAYSHQVNATDIRYLAALSPFNIAGEGETKIV